LRHETIQITDQSVLNYSMLNLNFSPFPVIQTDRLILRELEDGDVNEIFILRSDPRVIKYIDRAPAKSLEEASQFINNIKEAQGRNNSICWAIALKDDPRLIGTVAIWRIDSDHHRGEIGYTLLADYHGRGIMQEALTPVLHYGFHTIRLHSMEANVNPNNTASIKLLERNNFTREAYFKENYYFDGKYLDSVIYSLISPV
jgi:ribosomal-protein-alanine N-acetyltransferase